MSRLIDMQLGTKRPQRFTSKHAKDLFVGLFVTVSIPSIATAFMIAIGG